MPQLVFLSLTNYFALFHFGTITDISTSHQSTCEEMCHCLDWMLNSVKIIVVIKVPELSSMMFKGHSLPVYLEFPIYASPISTQDILNFSISDIINRIIWTGVFSKLFGTNSWHKAKIIRLSGIMGIKSLPTSNHWKFLTTCKKNVSPFIPTC